VARHLAPYVRTAQNKIVSIQWHLTPFCQCWCLKPLFVIIIIIIVPLLCLTIFPDFFCQNFYVFVYRLYSNAQVFYMGLVIFVPATAMEAMIDFPLWASVIISGTVATVYTTLVSPHRISLSLPHAMMHVLNLNLLTVRSVVIDIMN